MGKHTNKPKKRGKDTRKRGKRKKFLLGLTIGGKQNHGMQRSIDGVVRKLYGCGLAGDIFLVLQDPLLEVFFIISVVFGPVLSCLGNVYNCSIKFISHP